jgi:WD40 repeat protein
LGPEVRVHDAKTGKLLAGPLAGDGVGPALALRSDNRMLLTGAADGLARMWELPSGKPFGRAWACFAAEERIPDQHLPSHLHAPEVRRIAFDLTGRTIAALTVAYASDRKRPPRCMARAWEFGTDKVTAVEPKEWPDEALPMMFTLEGKLVLPAASAPRPARQLHQIFADDLKGKKVLFCGALSQDGSRALTGDGEGRLTLWDLATSKPVGEPMVYGKAERARLGELMRRDNPEVTAEQLEQVLAHLPPLCVTSVALSADGRRAAAVTTFVGAMTSGHVWLWDLQQRRVIAGPLDVSVQGKGSGSTGLMQFSPDGEVLAIGVNRQCAGQHLVGEVQLWELRPAAEPAGTGEAPPPQVRRLPPR